MKTKSPTAPKLCLKRQELLKELREAIRIYRYKDNAQLLEFCNITEATIEADCAWEGIPWTAICLHYYVLGIRAVKARSAGRFPDGSQVGTDNPDAFTRTYREIITSKLPEDTIGGL
jgi:hypothetical protein